MLLLLVLLANTDTIALPLINPVFTVDTQTYNNPYGCYDEGLRRDFLEISAHYQSNSDKNSISTTPTYSGNNSTFYQPNCLLPMAKDAIVRNLLYLQYVYRFYLFWNCNEAS